MKILISIGTLTVPLARIIEAKIALAPKNKIDHNTINWGNSTGWVGGYALALDADLLPQAVVEHHLDHSRARLSVTMSRAVRESVASKGGHASTFPKKRAEPSGSLLLRNFASDEATV